MLFVHHLGQRNWIYLDQQKEAEVDPVTAVVARQEPVKRKKELAKWEELAWRQEQWPSSNP